MTRKVLIIGGTGFIGSKISQIFRLQNYRVTVFHRQIESEDIPLGDEVHIHGNRHEFNKELASTHFDLVIDTCGYAPDDFYFLNYLSFSQFIFISSVAVYSPSIPQNSNETASHVDTNEESQHELPSQALKHRNYSIKKLQCENLLKEALGNISIVRPSIVLGEGDSTGRLKAIQQMATSKSKILIPNQTDRRFQFIDVNDLAILVYKLSQQASHGGTYNFVGPSMAWEEFLRILLDVFAIRNFSLVRDADFPFWDPYPNSGLRSLISQYDWISDFQYTSLKESLISYLSDDSKGKYFP